MVETKVLDYFSGDYNCAQSVLRAVLEEKGVYFEEAPALAAAFGGGIIGRGEICGAVSGALMAIGVLNSKLLDDMVEIKEATKKHSEIFYQKFEEIFGHNTCNGLIGIDRNDPEAKQKAVDAGIYKENCPKFVSQAVSIVLEMFKYKF